MERKKKMAMLALGLVMALVLSPVLVQATGIQYNDGKQSNENSGSRGQFKAASANRIRSIAGTQARLGLTNQQGGAPQGQRNREGGYLNCSLVDDLPEYIGEEIDQLLDEYAAMPETEEHPIRTLWILWARGVSWPIENEVAVNDEAPDERIPAGMRLAIRPIIASEDIVVFKVLRGVVGHNGTRYEVEGVGALIKEEGIFVMKLDGEGMSLKCIGKVRGRRWSLAVAMRGKMTVDGTDYAFLMRGRAFRLRRLTPEAFPETKTQVAPTSSA
jgi:hypothetical protein